MASSESGRGAAWGRVAPWVGLALIAVLVKLWLVNVQDLQGGAPARHDDALAIELAEHLLDGEWLGPYGERTLIKGPAVSFWIAAMYLLNVPLLLSYQLLQAFAAGLTAWALRPWLQRRGLLLVVFLGLLFDPMSFTNSMMTRAVRNALYPSLSLLVLACALGLWSRRHRRPPQLLAWSAGLGLALGAFWLTREEGIWILPSVVLLLAIVAAVDFYPPRRASAARLLVCLLPFLLWGLVVAAVAWGNWVHYGRFLTVELRSAEFLSAYGALTRAGATQPKPYVPAPEAVRRRLYEVSPAFAELRLWLEGSVGEKWRIVGRKMIPECDDLAAGWFLWALRESAAKAGHHGSALEAAAYYRRIGEEVNAACADGLLDCEPERATLFPVLRSEYVAPLARSTGRAALFVARFEDFDARPRQSIGSRQALKRFARLTHEEVAPTESPAVHLTGWAVYTEGASYLRVRQPNGRTFPSRVVFRPSPQAIEYFRSRGREVSEAERARFHVWTTCSDGCSLDLVGRQGVLASFPIDGQGRTIERPDLLFSLWPQEDRPAGSPLELRLRWRRFAALFGIARVYEQAVPWLALLATVAYLTATWSGLRRRRFGPLWVVATALAGAFVARLLVVALIDVTSYPAIRSSYLGPCYPILLTFVAVTLVEGGRRLRVRVAQGFSGWRAAALGGDFPGGDELEDDHGWPKSQGTASAADLRRESRRAAGDSSAALARRVPGSVGDRGSQP